MEMKYWKNECRVHCDRNSSFIIGLENVYVFGFGRETSYGSGNVNSGDIDDDNEDDDDDVST